MIKKICRLFEDKKVLILGFGKEGKSSYDFIRRHLPDFPLGIADLRDIPRAEVHHATLHTGADYEGCFSDYDLIIKSPGVVIKNQHPGVMQKLTSQTNMFLQLYRNQTVGVTGTKGKSTTASLLNHVLQSNGRDVLLIGNIGMPAFDVIEKIHSETIIIFELSSHQLEYVNVSPHIAILLNIFEEHLDHYGSFEKYIYAKQNIYRFQDKNDYFVSSLDIIKSIPILKSQVITVSDQDEDAAIFMDHDKIVHNGHVVDVHKNKLQIKGEHNFFNVSIAYAISNLLGISDEQFVEAAATFLPLPHRMEYIGTFDTVQYYDDSISTICQTTIQALRTLLNVGSIILGGMDRGIDYEPLVTFLLNEGPPVIILMPDTGHRIQTMLEEMSLGTYTGKQVVMAGGLHEAVIAAKSLTPKHSICLFSPAAASYGFYKDYAERGDVFRQYVLCRGGSAIRP